MSRKTGRTARVSHAETPAPVQLPSIQTTPRTPLGRRLRAIREKIVASGEPLLDWEAIDREVAQRRGRDDTEAA